MSLLERWKEFKSYLCEYLVFHTVVQQCFNFALHSIAAHVHVNNNTFTSTGLPETATPHIYINTDFYDLERERRERDRLMTMLNLEQGTKFESIVNAIGNVDYASPKMFSVNAFAESDKTFFNAIIHSIRGLQLEVNLLLQLHGLRLQLLF